MYYTYYLKEEDRIMFNIILNDYKNAKHYSIFFI